MPGTLFVVATPIGNLEDLTFRALKTLKAVDLIAAEDTRRTSRLLAHYEVHKPLTSLHEHNETREAPRLVERMVAGVSIALVSDAGTPGISDPGQTLVRLARAAGLTVVPIPGASAVTAALSISGLIGDGFTFMGFPPATGSARSEWFQRLADTHHIVVFFEAPHRIERTITDVSASCGFRPIICNRELTKMHEEFVMCTNTDKGASATIVDRGEFVVVVGQSPEDGQANIDGGVVSRARLLIGRMTDDGLMSESEAVEAVAVGLRLKAGKLRTALKKAAILAKRQADTAS